MALAISAFRLLLVHCAEVETFTLTLHLLLAIVVVIIVVVSLLLMMFLMLFGVLCLLGFLLKSLLFSSFVKRSFFVTVLDENLLILLKIDHKLLLNF